MIIKKVNPFYEKVDIDFFTYAFIKQEFLIRFLIILSKNHII